TIAEKVQFTGYIPRQKINSKNTVAIRKRFRIMDGDHFVLVTTGGGGDGYEVIDRYLAMHEYYPTSLFCKTVIITGPFMAKSERERLEIRARRFGIKIIPFHPQMETLISAADLVISMGGYNTICEILTQQTPSLIIPRETPRKEQLIRARKLRDQGLLQFLTLQEATPQLLREYIFMLLNNDCIYIDKMRSFELCGLDRMVARMKYFHYTRCFSGILPN
ncbi:MAG: glycosyltransferase, partial [Desulforhopalus sp.]